MLLKSTNHVLVYFLDPANLTDRTVSPTNSLIGSMNKEIIIFNGEIATCGRIYSCNDEDNDQIEFLNICNI